MFSWEFGVMGRVCYNWGMKKYNTSPISGMQELLPGLQAEFNRLKSGIAEAIHAHGFQNIETPTIDRTEILLAKAGGDTEKQIYKVVKTAETADDADQALRFDHTVPLARYTVEHMNDLAFPFKVSQIGRNFRGERAQKGRFREFYQCDADIIGWGTLPIAYYAEAIAALIDAMQVLPLPSIKVRVSNRKLLNGLLEELNLNGQSKEIFDIIDHAEKVPREATISALTELGIGSEDIDKVMKFIAINGSRDEVIPRLREFGFGNAGFNEGLAELDEVLTILERKLERLSGSGVSGESSTEASRVLPTSVVADMMIVRGLDYYTGTVFETIVPEHREIGSICGGGRYENLASNYTEQKLPGVGGSIGLTRLFYILQNYGLVEASSIKPVDVCLVPFSAAEFATAEELAEKLRKDGRRVDIAMTDKRLGDKMKYAAKVADSAIVIGEDEVRSGKFMVKDLTTGEVTEL